MVRRSWRFFPLDAREMPVWGRPVLRPPFLHAFSRKRVDVQPGALTLHETAVDSDVLPGDPTQGIQRASLPTRIRASTRHMQSPPVGRSGRMRASVPSASAMPRSSCHCKGVSVGVGEMTLTRMPRPPKSLATAECKRCARSSEPPRYGMVPHVRSFIEKLHRQAASSRCTGPSTALRWRGHVGRHRGGTSFDSPCPD